jgi:hypothetical protein
MKVFVRPDSLSYASEYFSLSTTPVSNPRRTLLPLARQVIQAITSENLDTFSYTEKHIGLIIRSCIGPSGDIRVNVNETHQAIAFRNEC